MATITLEVPDEISVTALESQIMAMARSMGLASRYGGHRRIKLMHGNPNSVPQGVRRIPILRDVVTPGVMDGQRLRLVPAMPTTEDDLAMLDRCDEHDDYAIAPQCEIERGGA